MLMPARRHGHAATALGRITRGSHRGPGLFDGLHIRHQEILNSDVEETLHQYGVIPRRPDHWCCRPSDERLQLAEDHRQFVGGMLSVNQKPVKARAGSHLRSHIAAETAPEYELHSLFEDRLLEQISG